ncbi:MAG: hypothetical protein LBC56_05695 [Oscillospiraceae bacterium]|jgi:hypothetical protein|nr:hypothetical protein [Oscillospiraceae bacterium]
MKKLFIIILGALILSLLCTACSALDVVQNDAVRAFGDVLSAHPAEYKNGWHQLTSPDGSGKLLYDNGSIWLAIDASPFIAAGLEASEIANISETVFYNKALEYSLPGWDMLNQNVKDGAFAQFEANAGHIRKNIAYHAAMDHYNIDFGGAMFEWAKDMKTNGYDGSDQDKDIVFVLNPEPLIAAGADPENVDGWTYAQVPVMQDDKEALVYKFLKAFNLQ